MTDEEIKILMNKIDKRCKMPKYWNEFIDKQTKNDNIFIKNIKTKEIYCTYCKKTFKSKNVNVGQIYTCPHCKNNYTVYATNYNRKSFETSVTLFQRINKQIIIRVFEIYSYFCNEDIKINRDINEYVRIIPGVGTFLGNNTYIGYMGKMIIYNENPYSWYQYKGIKNFSCFPQYPYNKKKLIKGTKLEYAPINEFMEKFPYYNFIETLQVAGYDSFELLWNLKLYNLSKDSDKFNKTGTFYNRFRVPKNFLKFMQDNDVSYRQLRIMQLLKNKGLKNMKKYIEKDYGYNNIRFFNKHKVLDEYINNHNKYDYLHMKTLKTILKYVSLKKFLKYPQGINNLYIYKDYLEMANKLALNYKSKRDLFPENLIERHDELQTKIKVESDIKHCFGIYLRFLELSKYIYEDDTYIIFPANSSEEFINEGSQQKNCVNYMYSQKYIDKETEIYFMRNLKNITKSLVTLEFNNNKVLQKEQQNHEQTTKQQNEFIEKWIMYRKFIDKKEKYTKKSKNKIINYDLEKLVA